MLDNINEFTCEQLALFCEASIETYRGTFTESNSEQLKQRYLKEALNYEKRLLNKTFTGAVRIGDLVIKAFFWGKIFEKVLSKAIKTPA